MGRRKPLGAGAEDTRRAAPQPSAQEIAGKLK